MCGSELFVFHLLVVRELLEHFVRADDDLIAGADAAMYEAKAVNKNCVRLAEADATKRGAS